METPVEVLVHARPTRHLERGLRPGYVYELNLRDPWVKRHLASGALVLLTDDAPVEDDEPEDTEIDEPEESVVEDDSGAPGD